MENHRPVMQSEPLVLRPQTSELVDQFVEDEALVRQIIIACGSPASILFPQAIPANLRAFESVLSRHSLRGKVHFAHKSNQSHCLSRQLALTSVAVDVASTEELRHALGCGFSGDRIEATGPKNAEFLTLCLQHGVTISVDSPGELEDIRSLRKTLVISRSTPVLLRLCGFHASRSHVLSRASRFGIGLRDVPESLRSIAHCTDQIELRGFAFHLDSQSQEERLVAIEGCLAAQEQAVELGLEPNVINIGGGFRINYLADEAEWNRYTSAISQAALGIGPQLTWHDNFFGISAHGGTLRGKINTYGYYEPNPGPRSLDALLESELPAYGNQRVADVLRDNMIELWLEPGRALLDQCGLTVARVVGTKESSTGDRLVALAMKRQDLAFLDQEVFVDPLRVGSWKAGQAAHTPVYLIGNLCLESDLIARRQVFVPTVPEPGDLLAFANTAAYMMDFSSTNSIMQPAARRVAVVRHDGRFTWMLDEQFTPAWDFYERK